MKKVTLKGRIGKGHCALVDDEDFGELSNYSWYLSAYGYAHRMLQTREKRASLSMQRHLIPTDKGLCLDHINGDKLDNRRSNLRIVTYSQNMFNMKPTKDNTSGYRGIAWHKRGHKWEAYISANKKKYHLGLFDSIDDALEARNQAAIDLHGEYAKLQANN